MRSNRVGREEELSAAIWRVVSSLRSSRSTASSASLGELAQLAAPGPAPRVRELAGDVGQRAATTERGIDQLRDLVPCRGERGQGRVEPAAAARARSTGAARATRGGRSRPRRGRSARRTRARVPPRQAPPRPGARGRARPSVGSQPAPALPTPAMIAVPSRRGHGRMRVVPVGGDGREGRSREGVSRRTPFPSPDAPPPARRRPRRVEVASEVERSGVGGERGDEKRRPHRTPRAPPHGAVSSASLRRPSTEPARTIAAIACVYAPARSGRSAAARSASARNRRRSSVRLPIIVAAVAAPAASSG